MTAADDGLSGVPRPLPVADLDRELARIVKRSRRFIWIILATISVLLVAISITTSVLVLKQNGERSRIDADVLHILSSQCLFYTTIGSLTPAPQTTRTGIVIIASAREVVPSLGCSRVALKTPSKELLKLAAKYHVKVPS